MENPFRYFNNSPEVIRLAVMMYIRYPLSLRQVVPSGDESNWQFCRSDLRSFAQQSSLNLTPAVSNTRESDGEIQGHQEPAEFRLTKTPNEIDLTVTGYLFATWSSGAPPRFSLTP